MAWQQEWQKGLEARKNIIQPIGAYFSQIGSLNYVHHVWCWKDLQHRKLIREKAWEIDEWAKTVSNSLPYIDKMNSRIMTPLEFSPLK